MVSLEIMKNILLIAASIITVASVIPYLRDILRGTTKPNIVSWITWTLLTAIATVAEFAAHEYTTAIFTSSAVVETGLVVALGIKYGHTKYTRFDIACQVGALLGFVLWWLFNSPALAVVAVVSIDLIGALPTIRHSWLQPGEETWPAYALAGLGGLLALFALTAYNWTSLTYAVYIVLVNLMISSILIVKGRRVGPVYKS